MARKGKGKGRGLLLLVILVAVASAAAFGLDRLDRDLSKRASDLLTEAQVLAERAQSASPDGWRRSDAVARTIELGGVEADLCRALSGQTWYLPLLRRTREAIAAGPGITLAEGTSCTSGANTLRFRY